MTKKIKILLFRSENCHLESSKNQDKIITEINIEASITPKPPETQEERKPQNTNRQENSLKKISKFSFFKFINSPLNITYVFLFANFCQIISSIYSVAQIKEFVFYRDKKQTIARHSSTFQTILRFNTKKSAQQNIEQTF